MDREKELMLKAVDSSQRKFFIIDPDYIILAANRYTKQLAGGNEIKGKYCYEVFCKREAPCADCTARQVKETCQPALASVKRGSFEVAGDGACFYSYPIFAGNEIEALVTLDFDIYAVGEMLERIERSNAFLHNLILSSVDGVIAADMTGRIIVFNEAASEITGYGMEEAFQNLDIRDVYPGDGAREVMRRLRSDDYGGRGKLKSYEVTMLRRDGGTIPIRLNASVVYEGEKEIASIGFFHDMTEELQMKANLEKAQTQLLQAEKMSSLGKLAAGVAHQLNNPLGGITLYAKLLLEDYDLGEDAVEDVNRILRDAQRGSETVKELLEFARQTKQKKTSVDINQAVSRTLFLLENQTLFHDIEIDKNFSEHPIFVAADMQQMNHVFMNIILNAAQAMESKGRLGIETALRPGGERMIIRITDTGPGIPAEVLAHIFEPFYTTKEEGKGTGLGLSLVYSIIDEHGGTISADNKPEGGAVFTIELPVETEKGDEESES
ncbi:MAG: ATP-binding protein [Desulfosudaceae bacterium]